MTTNHGHIHVLRRIPDGEPDPPCGLTIDVEFTVLGESFAGAHEGELLYYEPDGRGSVRFVYDQPASSINLRL